MAPMLDSMKASRLMRRLILPTAILFGFLLYSNYGWLRVPVGMDTLPEDYPAGTLCLILKTPSEVNADAVVFVDLPDGGTLLARVVALQGDELQLRADNPKSRFAELLAAESFSRESLRALVLTSFRPERSGDGR